MARKASKSADQTIQPDYTVTIYEPSPVFTLGDIRRTAEDRAKWVGEELAKYREAFVRRINRGDDIAEVIGSYADVLARVQAVAEIRSDLVKFFPEPDTSLPTRTAIERIRQYAGFQVDAIIKGERWLSGTTNPARGHIAAHVETARLKEWIEIRDEFAGYLDSAKASLVDD